MRFRDVCHQDRALSIIRRALASGRTHHAYLFEGPGGVGKELAARALAACLLCEQEGRAPAAEACGDCTACRLFAAGTHPDLHLIHRGLHKVHPDPAIRRSKGLFLGVDLIRHFLIEPAATTPSRGRRRVFVIRDAERMNEEAQNALLKTLEEPPGSACLILVTSSAERLLPTIRSRCQRIPFDLLPAEFVEAQLRRQGGAAPAAARTLAALAQGRLGAALQWQRIGLLNALTQVVANLTPELLLDPEAFGKRLLGVAEELAARTLADAGADGTGADNGAEEEGSSASRSNTVETDALREALKLVLSLLAAIYRDALLARSGCPGLRALPPGIDAVERLAGSADADQLGRRIEAIARVEWMLDRNVAPQLACEYLSVALTGDAAA